MQKLKIMNASTHGIHHVSCICSDAQQNLDFYVGVMGMRLVKRSINQDAPDTYHLFYADAVGTPGTDLTFFPIPGARRAQLGTGTATEISLDVPARSFDFWKQRLAQNGVTVGEVETRFGNPVLPFTDFDGLKLSLVAVSEERPFVPWDGSDVAAEFQVRGIHSVRCSERVLAPTEEVLMLLGFSRLGEENGWHRYGVDGGTSGQLIEVQEMPEQERSRGGSGGVHHVAWRTHNRDEEMELLAAVGKMGLQPSAIIDRFWFESVYFREPGGVLFELATDGPGFAVDEEAAHLGETLSLPPWLESRRGAIEAKLPPLRMPHLAQ